MVLFRPGDIGAHRVDLRVANGKGAVTALPREILERGRFGFSQIEEPRFSSFTTSAIAPVRDKAKSKCTWSSTPPDDDGLANAEIWE